MQGDPHLVTKLLANSWANLAEQEDEQDLKGFKQVTSKKKPRKFKGKSITRFRPGVTHISLEH